MCVEEMTEQRGMNCVPWVVSSRDEKATARGPLRTELQGSWNTQFMGYDVFSLSSSLFLFYSLNTLYCSMKGLCETRRHLTTSQKIASHRGKRPLGSS